MMTITTGRLFWWILVALFCVVSSLYLHHTFQNRVDVLLIYIAGEPKGSFEIVFNCENGTELLKSDGFGIVVVAAGESVEVSDPLKELPPFEVYQFPADLDTPRLKEKLMDLPGLKKSLSNLQFDAVESGGCGDFRISFDL